MAIAGRVNDLICFMEETLQLNLHVREPLFPHLNIVTIITHSNFQFIIATLCACTAAAALVLAECSAQ